MNTDSVIVRTHALEQDYLTTWLAMQHFTQHRTLDTTDEIWVLEHSPVYTQGQNGKPEHLLSPTNIPVIKTDRGGQITYHGPGQLIIYTLIDLKRKKLNTRQIVTHLEQSVIQLLAEYNIHAQSKCEAPGVYIHQQKICSVGLRIRRGCCFHGLALNVSMDLTPFSSINPCGFKGLEMTQLTAFNKSANMSAVNTKLVKYLIANLGYTSHNYESATF